VGGTSRFYAFHQTLPGELDVIGANVQGRPQVGLGTTEHIAWTSTVQTGPLNSFYMLTLVPGHPTQYLFDGQPREMIAETVTVQVPDGSGGFRDETHTFYSTHYGARSSGRDLSVEQRGSLRGSRRRRRLARDRRTAPPVSSCLDARVQGRSRPVQFNPSNQIGADSSGNAYYANTAQIPNLNDAQRAACAVPGALDGSRSFCMWNSDPDAAIPGIFGPSNLPSLIRTDFASNMNDSHWLANPLQPLTGFDSSIGSTNTARTFRTRSGLAQLLSRIEGTDGKGAPKFTLEHLQQLITDNLAYTGRRSGTIS
jgi:acyl-homoserine-lactone acylase